MSADHEPRVARSGETGFALLEVVVASVIAGLAVVVLLRAGGDGILAADSAVRTEEAIELAQSHLAAFGRTAAIAPGEWTGDDGHGYRWRLQARPLAEHAMIVAAGTGAPLDPRQQVTSDLVMYDVDVTISWSGGVGQRDRSLVLETLRLGAAAPVE